MILTGVMGTLCCAHHPVNADIFGGAMHGHTYEVWAWFDNECGRDVRILQASLDEMLKQWDHKVLPRELSTMEAIAAAVGVMANVIETEVYRRPERCAARWRRG